MKSNLIDALRQASGQDGADTPEHQVNDTPEKAEEASAMLTPAAGEGEDLKLEQDNEEIAADQVGLSVAESQLDPGFLLSSTTRDTSSSSSPGGSTVMARIGRLAPGLCLVAMIVAALGSLLLNYLAVSNLNEDLEELSGRAIAATMTSSDMDDDQNRPLADISVFNQIAALRVASQSLVQGESVSDDKETVSAATFATARTTKTTNPGGDAIRIGVSGKSDSLILDKAYAWTLSAFDAYRAQNYKRAENNYLEALEIEPHHPDALAGLAAVYQQTGRKGRAAEIYRKLLAFDPGNTAAASEIISLRSIGFDPDSESELKHLLQRFPKSHHLYFALGSLYVESGRWADARLEFLAAHQLAPLNADYSFNLAVSMERLGRFSEARSYFETALSTAEENSNVDKNAVARYLDDMAARQRERS